MEVLLLLLLFLLAYLKNLLIFMSFDGLLRYLEPFSTFSLLKDRQLAGTKPVKLILHVSQVLLNVVVNYKITHF
jgi:hypothetical protein